ncbi:MAG: tRNA pseudouridine(55) synthase TruB, partial [Thermomicrobiales bacterium]
LRRTNSGAFCLADSWTLDKLAAIDVREDWPSVALHPDAALADLPAVILGGSDQEAWYHGRSVHVASSSGTSGVAVRAYGDSGRFLGIGALADDDRLNPTLVLPREGERDEP